MTVASDAGAETVELLRRSGADVREDGSEAAVLWEKLARQAPVAAATALTQQPIGELRSDPAWRRRLEDAVAETCARCPCGRSRPHAGGAVGDHRRNATGPHLVHRT